jgi:phage gp36-like protein
MYCGANDVRRALTGSATAGGNDNPPTNTAADLDDEALKDSIEEASSVVDSYIDGPYDTTVDEIPAAVRFWARDIAAYLATLVWRKSKAPAANDPVVLRYQHAMKMLDGVAAGTITILGPENIGDQPTVVNPSGTNGVLFGPDNFDLWGRGEYDDGYEGWPLRYWQGQIYFAEYPD